MVSVAYVVPGTGMSETEQARRERVANELVGADVTVVAAEEGPPSVQNTAEEELAAAAVVRAVARRRDAFDGFLIGCFGDPGLHGAREVTDRPVVGPAAASFGVATRIADRFAPLTILDSTVPLTRRLLRSNGVTEQATPVRVVDTSVSAIDHDSEALIEEMIAVGRRAVEADGAEALVPGCMSLSFMRASQEVSEAVGVPVVDPVTVGIESVATFARHGITQSRATYPAADQGRLGLTTEPTPADE